jgi:hypothetical protein
MLASILVLRSQARQLLVCVESGKMIQSALARSALLRAHTMRTPSVCVSASNSSKLLACG